MTDPMPMGPGGTSSDILRDYNRWRRGEDLPQPDPRAVGRAIDAVLSEASAMRAALETIASSHSRAPAAVQMRSIACCALGLPDPSA